MNANVRTKLAALSMWTGACVSSFAACAGEEAGEGGGTAEASDSSSSAGPTPAEDGGPAGVGTVGADGSSGDDSGDGSGDSTAAPGTSSGSGESESSAGGDPGSESGTTAGAGSSESGEGEGGSSESGDDGTQELCEAPGDLISCDDLDDDPSIFNVIGVGCEGGPNEVIPIVGEGFNWTDPQTWRVIRRFGAALDPATGDPMWAAHEGDTMLMLSSGNTWEPDADGWLLQDYLTEDATGNPSNKPMPAPMSPAQGSGGVAFTDCDGVNDCSDSLASQWAAGGSAANDLIWFQFAAPVPAGTHGFSIDFAYFSEEFPEWVGTTFNDMFVVWSNSETYTGNLCFVDGEPCTVTTLWPTQFQAGNPALNQTGYSADAATGWFQIKGSAAPLELLQLTFAVFDMGDEGWDTAVLLDRFAWDCEGCTPSEVNPCGVIDPV
jgi:hypothetical protein